ncbi:rhamnogalacturonan acetylesterase [Colletotrichum truncatum]|uniref:Rhamnogalacturonan acetylesterase n=1 Tax=Colletotrichum truncatum TaxID=5467 RepID=A0ACC3ZB00_COLTU|nr:rhamnogalacturonan acetylesterase [Colletotrichum truncatum]KAF6783198.1 rhamnogalacturonan acetylesterase [Colletotrichum truncatum]
MKFLGLKAAVTAFIAVSAQAKVLICSDSTTATWPADSVIQGWGYYIGDYLTLPVTNLAKAGRSLRSFINEGRWDTLLKETVAGDYVIIEMGHNDDGNPKNDTKDRFTLPGTGNDFIVVTNSTGQKETVHSFGYYLRGMIADVKAKKAIPVVSGMVNRNYWKGSTLQSNWPFAVYAQEVAQQESVAYVDHTKYSVAAFQAMGQTKATTYFPEDKTHTSWPGAKINAETFVEALKCGSGGSGLVKYLNAAGKAVALTSCK